MQQGMWRVIGVMSGTSLDGVDAVLCSIHLFLADDGYPKATLHVDAHGARALTDSQRHQLLALTDAQVIGRSPAQTTSALCQANVWFADLVADVVNDVISTSGVSASDIDLVSSHGLTVWHAPDAPTPSTLQIGAPSVIAARTGITTVADFRLADVAAGGQGAPLVPYADYLMWRSATHTRATLNLGGIANITVLPPAATPADVVAGDTGPANMLIDALTQTYWGVSFDDDGQRAAQAHPDRDLLADLLADPYYQRPLPKSTGREYFGAAYAARIIELAERRAILPSAVLATATMLTAHTVADALRRASPTPPDELIVAGGGARNGTLMRWLAERLPATRIVPSDHYGIGIQQREAAAFALLGAGAVAHVALALPLATGARQAAVLGVIAPGRNFERMMAR